MLSLEALLLRIALAGLHDVNLDVKMQSQILWRAQHFDALCEPSAGFVRLCGPCGADFVGR